MITKTIMVYCSRYGTTKTYAHWIAEALSCDCIEVAQASNYDLFSYDMVVYGGGLYASGIAGIKKLKKHHLKQLVLFTVGLADPASTDYSQIIKSNMKSITADVTKSFHLRGGIDYSRLGIIHKSGMAMLKKVVLDKKTESELTSDDKIMIATYGSKVDFVSKETIKPIIDYVECQA